jgi:hypothetical protein
MDYPEYIANVRHKISTVLGVTQAPYDIDSVCKGNMFTGFMIKTKHNKGIIELTINRKANPCWTVKCIDQSCGALRQSRGADEKARPVPSINKKSSFSSLFLMAPG